MSSGVPSLKRILPPDDMTYPSTSSVHNDVNVVRTVGADPIWKWSEAKKYVKLSHRRVGGLQLSQGWFSLDGVGVGVLVGVIRELMTL